MTRCRAKMIDGSPVTFEFHDRGPLLEDIDGTVWLRRYHATSAPVHVSEMIGEGFHVVSVVPDQWDDRFGSPAAKRQHFDRIALERSGVDTATVERWEEGVQPRSGWWVPMFPIPTYDNKPISSWSEAQARCVEPTGDMVRAGISTLLENMRTNVPIDVNMMRVWRAMEKARQ